jgi:Carboxypeptidase regulatory-like domain
MRRSRFTAFLLLSPLCVFGQSDRGTITGAVADTTGAVVASASVEVRNVQTGALYQAATSTTGNYTLAQLPTGTYQLTVTVPGFKRFVRENLLLPVAQTLRVDAVLEVGASSESVTVAAESPLLKTESGELSHNVGTDALDNLPVLGIGSGASSAGIRNPYAVLQVLPGSDWRPDTSIRLNGMPSNTEAMRIEGQDATNGLYSTQSQTQPSVDAIEEFAVETSNYAAEYGQVGGVSLM